MTETQRKAKFFSPMRRFNQLGAMLDRSLAVERRGPYRQCQVDP